MANGLKNWLLLVLVTVSIGPTGAASEPTDATVAVRKPLTIVKPGRYVVVGNITAPGPIIEIKSDDVHIDLNGFKLESTDELSQAVQALGTPLRNVTLVNGTLGGPGTCAAIDRVDGLVLRRLLTSGCALGVFLDDNDQVTAEDNTIVGSEGGMLVDSCDNCRFTGNSFVGGPGPALSINGGFGIEIARNTATASQVGIRVGGQGVLVRDNVVSNTGTALVIASIGGLVQGNVLASSVVGLMFEDTSLDNIFRGNVSRTTTVALDDQGTGNLSHGDNYLPGIN